jgi:citronellyl-CoA dehydrogenase
MQLTHEHEELKRSLMRFIDKEINPHVDEWEEAGIFPAHELFGKMGALGFLGLTKPLEYGGGADEVMLGIICKHMGILPPRRAEKD